MAFQRIRTAQAAGCPLSATALLVGTPALALASAETDDTALDCSAAASSPTPAQLCGIDAAQIAPLAKIMTATPFIDILDAEDVVAESPEAVAAGESSANLQVGSEEKVPASRHGF